MGYYTNYLLWIENEDELRNTIQEEVMCDLASFSEEFKDDEDNWDEANPLATISWDSRKWYEYDDDMRTLSAHFPECKFILEGIGEDCDDRWRMYYFDGRSQYAPAQITYDKPFWE